MDRITHIRIKNVRAIRDVELDLHAVVTVLIGENGAGKSTIVECLELLRKAAERDLSSPLYSQHRGVAGLFRKGETEMTLGLRIEGEEPPLRLEFTLRALTGGSVAFVREVLSNDRDKFPICFHENGSAEVFDWKQGKRVPVSPSLDGLTMAGFGSMPPDPRIARMLAVLKGIEVHVGFDTMASWAALSTQRPQSTRVSSLHFPASRLSFLGQNLASAWSALGNASDEHWRSTMDIVRLGLGDGVDKVIVSPDPGGGNIALALRRKDLAEAIPAANLSDGQLTWLAFVALVRLNSGRSLLVIDEPELHLHPALLGRVMSLLTSLEGGAPVLITTHSDRVLSMLDDPAGSVRVCELNGSEASVLRIDPKELDEWLKGYGDIGELRASGYLDRVLVQTSNAVEEKHA